MKKYIQDVLYYMRLVKRYSKALSTLDVKCKGNERILNSHKTLRNHQTE